MAFFEVDNLVKDFGGLKAIEHLTYGVKRGELLGIVGPNGSGKTTCFNIFTGYLKPSSGDIRFKGKSIVGLAPQKIPPLGIVRTFQLTNLFSNLTVMDNILIGLYLKLERGLAGPLVRTFFVSKKFLEKEMWARDRAEELMDALKLTSRQSEIARNLPGPDQRRLEIAVALGSEPELLLLDEPVAGMRPDETDQIGEVIRQLLKGGYTILLVEHNMRFVMGMCKRIIVLDQGTKIAEGTPDEIYANSEVRQVYLGGSS
jgi:branched-chain amino acid transport system ATP-binding protein